MGKWEEKMMGLKGLKMTTSLLLIGGICAFAQAPVNTKLKKILVLDKSQGGDAGHLESRRDLNAALKELATAKGFTVVTIGQSDAASKISTEFSAANLATYQAVLFSNNDGVDAQLDATSRTNVENYVKNGGGFVPIHAASAFIGNWPWIKTVLVQSFFGPHGSNQPTANVSHDAEGTKDGTETKGIYKGLTAPLAFLDEYYSFQATPRGVSGVTILLTVDEKSYSKTVNGPMGADHPVVWSKTDGKGRVVHLSMGHSWSTNNVFTAKSKYLQNFLYGTLRYVAGDFVGCTDSTYVEYNPDATKNDQPACLTKKSVTITLNQSAHGNPNVIISQNENKSFVNIEFLAAGSHELKVTDLAGKQVYQRIGSGQERVSVPTPTKSGIYFVRAKANGKITSQRITVL